jgi:GAF domain-containing protein
MQNSSVRTEYEKRLGAFYQYLQDLQKQTSVDGLGKASRNFLKEWFQFDLIWIAYREEAAGTLVGLDGIVPNQNRDQSFLRRPQTILPGDLFDQVLVTGHLQQVPSLKQEQRVGPWQTIAQQQGIQGSLILPIRYQQQSLGILLVGTTLWGGHPRPDELTELKMATRFLGAALSALQQQSVQQVTGSTAPPLAEVVNRVLSAATFEECLKLAFEYVYAVVQPTRICMYWFDVEGQLCRLQDIYAGPQAKRAGPKIVPAVEISLPDIAGFYQATLGQQTVAVGDIQNLVGLTNAPARLMHLTHSQAWLSAPVFEAGRLIGVLAAESNAPQLWQEQDKETIQLMAKLLGLNSRSNPRSTPLNGTDPVTLNSLFASLREVEEDSSQWHKTLSNCLEVIGFQFAVRWAALLSYDANETGLRCRTQFVQRKKQPLPESLPEVSTVDAKLLQRADEPIRIQSVDQDLRLLNWRQPLMERGVQSYLLVKLYDTQASGAYLLLGADLQRTWTDEEARAIQSIAQSLGQALQRREQWQQRCLEQQLRIDLYQGIQAIQQVQQSSTLLGTATQAIQKFLNAECLIILGWTPGGPEASIMKLFNQSRIQIDPSTAIPWQTDGFVQGLLAQSAAHREEHQSAVVFARGNLQDLAAHNSGWLAGTGLATLLAIPLQVYSAEPSLGIVLAIESRQQHWSSLHQEGFQLLTQTLSAQYRTHHLVQQLSRKQETLECLNWYKQRHLEYLFRLWTEQMSKFQSILAAATPAEPTSGSMRGRGRHPAGDLYQAFSDLESILKNEMWDLQLEPEPVPVATFLRRSLERIEDVVRTRQLWTQVHNQTPSISLQIPKQKLEMMLVELLLAACYRSKIGDRIDIWCRVLQESWLEISITDQGLLNPQLVSAIQAHRTQSPLSEGEALLDSLLGRHFKVCQALVERFGGKMELAQLEDGRSLSRLILPLPAPIAAT